MGAMQQELELTSRRLLALWWALTWRFAALFFALSAAMLLLSCVAGLVVIRAGVMGYDHITHLLARVMIVAWLFGVPILGLIATRLTLQSRRGGFRLALLANMAPKGAEPSPASP
jgi:hypothetical protein